jgi:ADP-ribose pyrophosphatase
MHLQHSRVPCDPDSMAIRTLSTREVYRNHWLSVREDAIERTDGTHGIYGVVDKHDCAAILPIDGDHIWLVEQFRYTIGERALELPQGGWESAIDNPEELARGELREETGLVAGRMTALPWMWIAYGFARQRQHIYIAEELTPGPHERDYEEADMQVVRLPIATFEEKLRTGQIRDVCTIAAWGSYQLWLKSNR